MTTIVNMACGLANRMFQYSYYLYLKQNGFHAEIDAYASGVLAHEEVDWNKIFPNATFEQTKRWKAFLLGGGNDLFSRFRRKLLPFATRVLEQPTAFDYNLPSLGKSSYVIGVFQNALLIESVKREIIERFAFIPFEDSRNTCLAEEMKKCESVAIHVRKGNDYQQRIWYQNTCPMEYYTKAIALMKSQINKPVFYVFTDNKEWVIENFNGIDYHLVEHNPGFGWGSHCDMQLMSLCKHNIISNSTYSWWGAFLNKNTKKIVMMPSVWFNPDSCDEYTSHRLACNGWQMVE